MAEHVRLVGTYYRGQDTVNLLKALPEGTVVSFKHEPDNQHDPNAVKVMYDGIHLGYVEAALSPFCIHIPTATLVRIDEKVYCRLDS